MGFTKTETSQAVIDDFRAATGETLKLESQLGFGAYLNYDIGYFYTRKIAGSDLFMAAGVEGWLEGGFPGLLSLGDANEGTVDAEISHPLLLAWAYYLRIGATF
jgi:hypothetical protein